MSRKYPPIALHRLSTLNAAARERLLARAETDLEPFIEKVKPIVEAVRRDGDAALVHYAREFDGAHFSLEAVAATPAEFDQAMDAVGPEMVDIMAYAAENIRRFHVQQRPPEMWQTEIRPGLLVGERFRPIDSVACYSPRGKGSFPVVTLMSTIPAVVAGVPKIVVLTPAGPDGSIDPATLVAARLAGVETVCKAGGAVAVAAAAYGTETVPRCHRIEGPGSPWLAAAKRLLAGRIDPGMPAGPSETILLADPEATPEIVALDLLIESEHGPDSGAFVVTWSEALAQRVIDAIPHYWDQMSDTLAGYSATVLSGERGGIVLAADAEEAYAFINDYAPEHLQVLSPEPLKHLSHIRNAAEIMLGEHTAGVLANYMMGPNCVLPTSGAAHTHSPLGVHNFMKSQSIGQVTAAAYAELAPRVKRFAEYEGFDGHANAVSDLREQARRGELPPRRFV